MILSVLFVFSIQPSSCICEPSSLAMNGLGSWFWGAWPMGSQSGYIFHSFLPLTNLMSFPSWLSTYYILLWLGLLQFEVRQQNWHEFFFIILWVEFSFLSEILATSACIFFFLPKLRTSFSLQRCTLWLIFGMSELPTSLLCFGPLLSKISDP